jgi:hypothetical protein
MSEDYTVIKGMADEILVLSSRIKELESQLAEAKKEGLEAKQDQARYYWMQDWIEDRVKGTKEFFRAKTRSDFDTSIDAAIASIQEGK